MNIDLGSPVIDIAIGLSFVFFLLSVIASAIGEFFAGVVNLRGKTLLKGIEGMIGDEEIARKVFEHPLVRTNGKKSTKAQTKADPKLRAPVAELLKRERKPSYVSAENFALALLQVAKENPQKTTKKGEKAPGQFLWEQLKALRVSGRGRELETDRKKVEKWFEDSMDRVSGWYKRRAQWIMIGIAILVAVGLNANTLRIVERLQQEPSTRAAVVKAAESALAMESQKATGAKEAGGESEETEEAGAGGEGEGAEEADGETTEAATEIKEAGESFSKATSEVTALQLPFLWGEANDPSAVSTLDNIAGWLLTVIAISLGAPFWFDALGKLANLRLAGKKPEEKDPAAA